MELIATQGPRRNGAWDAGAPDEVGTVRGDFQGEGTAAQITRGNPFSEQAVYLWFRRQLDELRLLT